MRGHQRAGRRLVGSAITVSAVVVLAMVMSVPALAGQEEGSFVQTNLVSDISGQNAAVIDPTLKNPWGLSASPSSPVWVSDNNAGATTLYLGNGTKVILPFGGKQTPFVAIQPSAGSPDGTMGSPTGTVFGGTTDFAVSQGGKSGGSFFLFATEDGTIQGWNPGVNVASAIIGADNGQGGAATGAVYKGLALASVNGKNYLYASNFRSGQVDVFDSQFKQQTWAGAFVDHHIPAGYAPFNIQNLNGLLYVTYAVQNAAKHDDEKGPGRGFVDVFTPGGHLQKRLIRHGALNSPWGLAIAPATWGDLAGDLLVGNFGDGRIDAYNAHNGHFRGALADGEGRPISIEGLWGLRFGNGGAGASLNALYFAAGINGEQDGLLGTITPSPDNHND